MKRKVVLKKTSQHNNLKLIILITILILLINFFMLKKFSQKVTPKVIEIAKVEANNVMYEAINKNVNKILLQDNYFDEIIIITKNSEDEIIMADYDLNKAYRILQDITDNIGIDLNKKGINLNIPFGSYFDSSFLNNIGPNIPVKINFIGAFLSNLKTKITNYGMNNALAELYVTLYITEEIITPVTKKIIEVNYDVLISSKVISGRVPSYYGNSYESNSKLFNISKEK